MATQVDGAAERQRLIADRLRAVGRVEVVDLAWRLDVAQETIRRDLRLLEQQGLLQRVHGGAVRITEQPLSPFDGPIPPPAEQHVELAELLAGELPADGVVFLGSSAITTALAEVIARRDPTTTRVTTFVTTSLDVAVILSRIQRLTVVNIGGTVDPDTRTQQGDWALAELQRIRCRLAILPASGLTAEDGAFAATTMAAATVAAAARGAEQVWLVVDPEAVGRPDFVIAVPRKLTRRVFVSGAVAPGRLARLVETGLELTVVK